jgi:hypothetical protein
LHKLLGDRQSEPRAAVFSGRGDIGLAERFEQMLLRFSPGHGSNFSFSLPVQVQADPRPIDSADHVLNGARVLIADAHPTTGRFLQSQLAGSQRGRVYTIDSGEKAYFWDVMLDARWNLYHHARYR